MEENKESLRVWREGKEWADGDDTDYGDWIRY